MLWFAIVPLFDVVLWFAGVSWFVVVYCLLRFIVYCGLLF